MMMKDTQPIHRWVLPQSSDGMDSSADIDGIDVPKSVEKNASKKEESE